MFLLGKRENAVIWEKSSFERWKIFKVTKDWLGWRLKNGRISNSTRLTINYQGLKFKETVCSNKIFFMLVRRSSCVFLHSTILARFCFSCFTISSRFSYFPLYFAFLLKVVSPLLQTLREQKKCVHDVRGFSLVQEFKSLKSREFQRNRIWSWLAFSLFLCIFLSARNISLILFIKHLLLIWSTIKCKVEEMWSKK